MSATRDEMLDALVAVSAEMGRARTLLAQAERAHANARRKADTYPALREARKNLARAEAGVALTKARTKKLASPGVTLSRTGRVTARDAFGNVTVYEPMLYR